MEQAQGIKDLEIKERLSPEACQKFLCDWVNAISQNQDFEFTVRQQTCVLPPRALTEGRIQVEYEVEDGEYELELKVKWR